MYCRNCGTKLDDSARFCFGCGTQVINDAPAASNPTPQPASQHHFERPAAPKRKKAKFLPIAAVAAGAVLVVAVAILLFSGLFGGGSAKVASAYAKSSKAFATAVEKMELTDVASLVEGKKVSEDLSVWIDEIDGSTATKGMGVRLSADSNLPGRTAAMTITQTAMLSKAAMSLPCF